MYESLFVLSVLVAIHRRLISARDLIIDSALLHAGCGADPDAAIGMLLPTLVSPVVWVSRSLAGIES
jgi:hypothetical protein